jgi:plastocyanin
VANVSVALTGGATRNATTSGTGAYSFGNLTAGAYTVAITVPAGLQLAAGQTGSRAVTVTAGQTTTANFELEEPAPTTGTISGAVRAGATGVAGATLTLTGNGENRNTPSAANGSYAFATVAPGSYSVHAAAPAGYALAPGEDADKAAVVEAGQTTTVNFAVVDLNPATTIEAGASTFTPGDVTVAVGTLVRWTNGSGVAHTVTPSGHGEWAEAQLPNNGTFEHDFDTVGVFPYLCTIHAGMTGVVRVQ